MIYPQNPKKMKPKLQPLLIHLLAIPLFGISVIAQQDTPVRKPTVIEQPLGEENDPDDKTKPVENPPPAPPPLTLPSAPKPPVPPVPPAPPSINLPLGFGDPAKPPSPDIRPSPPPRPAPAPQPTAALSPATPSSTVKLEEIIKQTQTHIESLTTPPGTVASQPRDTAASLQAIEERIKQMQGSYDASDAANIQSIKEMGEELKRLQAEREARRAELIAKGKQFDWSNFYYRDREIQLLEKQIIAAVRRLQDIRKKRADIETMIGDTKNQLESTGHLEDPSRANKMEEAVRRLELEALQQQLDTLKMIQEERSGGGPSKPGPMEVAVGDNFYLASALADALREINMVGAHELPLSIADIKTFNGPLGDETPYDEPAENETPLQAQLRRAKQQAEIARRALELAQSALHNARDTVAARQELELSRQERDLMIKAQIDFPGDSARQQAEVKRQMISLRTRAILDRSRQTAELSKTLEAGVTSATEGHQKAQVEIKRIEQRIEEHSR